MPDALAAILGRSDSYSQGVIVDQADPYQADNTLVFGMMTGTPARTKLGLGGTLSTSVLAALVVGMLGWYLWSRSHQR
jgi:hypothetical protein